jgi:hypothetical protein
VAVSVVIAVMVRPRYAEPTRFLSLFSGIQGLPAAHFTERLEGGLRGAVTEDARGSDRVRRMLVSRLGP